jgi:PadR family transcriptional regulator, regulatory protein PadR
MANDDLLFKWEEVYKKGLLTFWILLLLYERPSYPFEMRPLVEEISQRTITADDNSIYRTLTRFSEMGIVTSEIRQSSQGPDRRYYRLTEQGFQLLKRFIERNIRVFETAQVAARLDAVCSKISMEEAR